MKVTALLVALMAVTETPSYGNQADKNQKKVDKAIAQLSHEKPGKRVDAVKDLEKVGASAERALPALVSATEDPDPAVAARAKALIQRLGPQAMARAASAATDADMRNRMVSMIDHPSVLGELVRTGPEGVRTAALERLEDEAILVELARSGPPEVRAAAAGKIKNPATLADLARSGPDEVRVLAVNAIEDDKVLQELAESGPDDVRVPAVQRIQDRATLVALAKTGTAEVQAAAIAAIGDPDAVAELLAGTTESVRTAALDWLSQRVLESASLEERLRALKHLDDGARLAGLCEAAPADTLPAIVEKISDPAALASLSKHQRPEVARAAVARVSDPAVLAEAAKHPDAGVRVQAVRRLKGDRALGPIALKDASAEVRLAALTRLTSQSLLIDIAAKDKETALRKVAADLALKPNRGKLPVVALLGLSGGAYGKMVRQKIDVALKGKAIPFACSEEWNCSVFASQIKIELAESDSDQCFDKYTLINACNLRGKNVHITLTYMKGKETLLQHEVAAQTPDVITYTVVNYLDLGPQGDDVARETSTAVSERIKELSIDFSEPTLAAMLEP